MKANYYSHTSCKLSFTSIGTLGWKLEKKKKKVEKKIDKKLFSIQNFCSKLGNDKEMVVWVFRG